MTYPTPASYASFVMLRNVVRMVKNAIVAKMVIQTVQPIILARELTDGSGGSGYSKAIVARPHNHANEQASTKNARAAAIFKTIFKPVSIDRTYHGRPFKKSGFPSL